MSNALWCGYGRHAFDGDDPDAVQDTIKMNVRQSDGSYLPRTLQRDICGEHVAEAVNFVKPQLESKGNTHDLP